MLSAALVYADGTASPVNKGLWIAYGAFDIEDEFFGCAEFWLAYREGDEQSLASLGATIQPITFRHGRLGWGPFFNAGFEQRRGGGRVVLAGVLGAGGELVVRLSDRWDFATAAELDYLTTLDSEFQFRAAIRYHSMKISAWKGP
jgi:hypothetical protein